MTASATLSLTAGDIIRGAFKDARIIPSEQPVQAVDLQDGLTALNIVIKQWQAQGIHLWGETEGIIPLVTNQNKYLLGPTGAEVAEADTFVDTTLTVASAALDTTLDVVSTTGMAATDRIGIELDDGTRQWTTIVSVDSATAVTITTGLTGASKIGNTVYSYSKQIDRPIRVLSMQFGSTLTASEIPVNQWSREEYFDQPDKTSSGTVVQWYYSPQLTNGDLRVWQVASSVRSVLRFTYVRPINVPGDQVDTLDFPSEWFKPLKWALAAEIGPSYGVPESRQAILESKAATTLDEVLDHDVERDSMQIQPDFN